MPRSIPIVVSTFFFLPPSSSSAHATPHSTCRARHTRAAHARGGRSEHGENAAAGGMLRRCARLRARARAPAARCRPIGGRSPGARRPGMARRARTGRSAAPRAQCRLCLSPLTLRPGLHTAQTRAGRRPDAPSAGGDGGWGRGASAPGRRGGRRRGASSPGSSPSLPSSGGHCTRSSSEGVSATHELAHSLKGLFPEF